MIWSIRGKASPPASTMRATCCAEQPQSDLITLRPPQRSISSSIASFRDPGLCDLVMPAPENCPEAAGLAQLDGAGLGDSCRDFHAARTAQIGHTQGRNVRGAGLCLRPVPAITVFGDI